MRKHSLELTTFHITQRDGGKSVVFRAKGLKLLSLTLCCFGKKSFTSLSSNSFLGKYMNSSGPSEHVLHTNKEGMMLSTFMHLFIEKSTRPRTLEVGGEMLYIDVTSNNRAEI